jgi:hypothetical protein
MRRIGISVRAKIPEVAVVSKAKFNLAVFGGFRPAIV